VFPGQDPAQLHWLRGILFRSHDCRHASHVFAGAQLLSNTGMEANMIRASTTVITLRIKLLITMTKHTPYYY
jgi:hypothetical protein